MKYYKIAIPLILLLCITQLLSAQKDIKLISYNVYWGMRQDSTEYKSKFSKWIKSQDPDILALQEVNGFTQKMIEDFAASYGHPFAIIVKEPAPDGSISFPVAITSKFPIVNVTRVVDNMIHGMLLANVDGFNFIVTHFHPFSSEKRSNEIDLVLATINSNPTFKWLLIGDLNSVSPLDKEGYENGLLLKDIREDMKKRPQNENLKNNELDYSIQQKILDYGMIDAFKVFHPKFEPSAPTKLWYDQAKSPLRYDYIYVSKDMSGDLISCDIIKDEFTDIYSDHYPVRLILKK